MADEMGNLREERTGPNMVWELRGEWAVPLGDLCGET